MKITQARGHWLRYPVQTPFANSRTWVHHRTAWVVELVTDNGLTGWGEGAEPLSQHELDTHVVGRDPFHARRIWLDLYNQGWGRVAGISAVDIALHDLQGKAAGRPVHELLGGISRDRVPCYASGLFRKDRPDNTAGLVDEARRYIDLGYGAIKMKIGLGAGYDVTNVEAIRRAVGDHVLFAVDANCGYDVATAIDVGQRLTAYDPYWFEEPIADHDVAGNAEIRHALAGTRLAGGEQRQGLIGFRDTIAGGAFDIVQPDISISGGFTECRRIEALAQAHGIRVLPHMWGTAIRLAATLHWQATIPDDPEGLAPQPCLFEYDMTENGLRTELAMEPIEAIDGVLTVPDAPGLGIEINRDVLDRYRVNGME